eukprot:3329297-Pyramimonas_sp.AAC.1
MSLRRSHAALKSFHPLLKGGYLVCHIRMLEGGDKAAILASGPGADAVAGEAWAHVALFNEKPIRPTFVLMDRNSARDEGGTLGLDAQIGQPYVVDTRA